MINFIETKRNYLMALAILFVIVSLSGTTYSLFIKTDTTNTFEYTTGLLDLQFIEDEKIMLDSVFAMIDSEGEKQKTYKLVLKNTGNLAYIFDLKMVSNTTDNEIDSKYIKVKVNNSLPNTLSDVSNIIASNLIIYPGEEKSFNINVWLDIDTPNSELGKIFDAKVIATGNSIYKTLDTSGANHPEITPDMIPVYYDTFDNQWKKADHSNTINTYQWYNYDNSLWANSIILKNTDKYIYDITRNNNIKTENIEYNNQNMIINNSYLDIGLNDYRNNNISTILRVKTNDLINKNIYLLTNDNLNYYYDFETKKFVFEVNNNKILSNVYELKENTWYILGMTYNNQKVSLYVDGNKIFETNISGNIFSSNSFKVGIHNNEISNYTLGDIYVYSNILNDKDISNYYKNSINIIYDNLICGYNNFIPMTLNEYYQSKQAGTSINYDDILSFYVWIPRFKYKLWNVTGEENIDIYNAYQKGIDISFEKENLSSGVIYCNNNECYSDELLITKVTKNDNGKYYTHPAFTNNEKQLKGFWIGKYEVSENNIFENKKGNKVWTNNSLINFYDKIKTSNNNYNIIKNIEWGAVTYLTHSKYGLCKNNICQKISGNNTFISGNELKDSTTNNLTGVFDMSGSAAEFTMTKYASENIPTENEKVNNDYDLYYQDNFILGDAIKELTITDGIWYNSTNIFIDNINNYLLRGGILNRNNTDIYSYISTTSNGNENITTRIVIK